MDWRVSFVVCLVVASSSANVPLVSPGYAKTSVSGSGGTGGIPQTKYIQMRSAKPETIDDPNKLRMVPTSFSEIRQPFIRNPEPIAATPQETPTGRALPDFTGRALPDFTGRALPDFTGRALSDFTGRALPDSTGRSLSDSTGRALPDSTGRALPDSTGRALPDSTGRALPDSTGRALPDSTGRALPDSNFLSSAIARSFQDVLPSDVNSLTSSTTDDIQKSPLATEYSYGNSGYYEYPQAQERYHPQHPYQAGYPADYYQSPPTGTVSDIGDVSSSNSIMAQKNPADSYQPAPYSPPSGYPSYSPYPYSYNPPAPPPPPEEPPEEDEDDDDDLDKGVYTHYNIGRKLYYAPLWFSLYMTGYLFVEICKHVWRHKYTFPVRAEDALGIGRSAGDNATHIEHVTKVVTNAIETSTKKYNKS